LTVLNKFFIFKRENGYKNIFFGSNDLTTVKEAVLIIGKSRYSFPADARCSEGSAGVGPGVESGAQCSQERSVTRGRSVPEGAVPGASTNTI